MKDTKGKFVSFEVSNDGLNNINKMEQMWLTNKLLLKL